MKIKCEIVHKCGLPNYSSVSVGLSVTKDLEPEDDTVVSIQSLFKAVEVQVAKEMKEIKAKLT